MIAAIGERNRVIGMNNTLPWSVSLIPDKKRFKEETKGSTVIMGRHTWESLEEKYRPLPGRDNIVVTRQQDLTFPGARVAYSLHGALSLVDVAGESRKVFIIGGTKLYELGLRLADELLLTLVDEDARGTVFFPRYKKLFRVVSEEVVPKFLPKLTFQTLRRR